MRNKDSCLKKTLEYLFVLQKGKRFTVLFLMMLPLGFLLAVAMPANAYYSYIKSYSAGAIDFWSAWNFNGAVDYRWSLGALAVALIYYIFIGAVCFTVISRSLRVGVFDVKRPIYECNENFFPTMYSAFSYLALLLLVKALNTACLTLFSRNASVPAGLTFSIISIVAMYALVSYVLTIGTLYTPFMVFNGVNSLRAFVLSAGRINGRKCLRTYPALFLPVFGTVLVGALVGFFESALVSIIVETVLYACLAVYLITYPFISYYTINELKREDYTREYYYKHGRD